MRAGSVLISTSATLATRRASTVRSECARAWHSRTPPRASSSAVMPSGRPVRVADLPGDQARAAGAAVPGLAAVRQVEPGGERGLEHRLARRDAQRAPVRLDSNAVILAQAVMRLSLGERALQGRLVARGWKAKEQPCSGIRRRSRSPRSCAVYRRSPWWVSRPTAPARVTASPAPCSASATASFPSRPWPRASSGRRPWTCSIRSRTCSEPGERIDIVDVFRRPVHVPGIVADCIRLKLPALWLQEGVIDAAAAERAAHAGIFTVMDRCIFRDRAALR